MPVCPVCGTKSQQLGMLCKCGKAYTIQDDQPKDPLDILGKQIASKFVPIAMYRNDKSTISYEAWQTAVERMVTLIVMKPEVANDENQRRRFFKVVNGFSVVHQQNLPLLFEKLEMTEYGTYALICDVRRGEMLKDYLEHEKPNDVILIHIIHQIIQGLASFHRFDLCVPNLGYEQAQIVHLGGDTSFVKFTNVLETFLSTPEEEVAPSDDVWCLGQLALSILTGQPIPITNVELTEERAYLMSIVQIFMRATAPIEERYQNAGELLTDFETVLDVHPKAPKASIVSQNVIEDPKHERQVKNLVELKQVLWMHQPPHCEN